MQVLVPTSWRGLIRICHAALLVILHSCQTAKPKSQPQVPTINRNLAYPLISAEFKQAYDRARLLFNDPSEHCPKDLNSACHKIAKLFSLAADKFADPDISEERALFQDDQRFGMYFSDSSEKCRENAHCKYFYYWASASAADRDCNQAGDQQSVCTYYRDIFAFEEPCDLIVATIRDDSLNHYQSFCKAIRQSLYRGLSAQFIERAVALNHDILERSPAAKRHAPQLPSHLLHFQAQMLLRKIGAETYDKFKQNFPVLSNGFEVNSHLVTYGPYVPSSEQLSPEQLSPDTTIGVEWECPGLGLSSAENLPNREQYYHYVLLSTEQYCPVSRVGRTYPYINLTLEQSALEGFIPFEFVSGPVPIAEVTPLLYELKLLTDAIKKIDENVAAGKQGLIDRLKADLGSAVPRLSWKFPDREEYKNFAVWVNKRDNMTIANREEGGPRCFFQINLDLPLAIFFQRPDFMFPNFGAREAKIAADGTRISEPMRADFYREILFATIEAFMVWQLKSPQLAQIEDVNIPTVLGTLSYEILLYMMGGMLDFWNFDPDEGPAKNFFNILARNSLPAIFAQFTDGEKELFRFLMPEIVKILAKSYTLESLWKKYKKDITIALISLDWSKVKEEDKTLTVELDKFLVGVETNIHQDLENANYLRTGIDRYSSRNPFPIYRGRNTLASLIYVVIEFRSYSSAVRTVSDLYRALPVEPLKIMNPNIELPCYAQ